MVDRTDDGSAAGGFTQKRAAPWLAEAGIVILLLGAHFALGLSAARQKSLTFDEPYHFIGGWSIWRSGDYSQSPDAGVLSQMWATLPEVFVADAIKAPEGEPISTWNSWKKSELLLYYSGHDAATMIGRGRVMIGFLGVALGLVIYLWSRRLFGNWGGGISVAAYSLSPTMLANNFLVTTDTATALFFTLAAWSLWSTFNRVSLASLLAAILSTAGLVLAKFSGLLILPIAAVLLILRLCVSAPLIVRCGRWQWSIHRRWSQLGFFLCAVAAILLAVVVLIWAAYGFRFAPNSTDTETQERFIDSWSVNQPPSEPMKRVIQFARAHELLPEAYLYGLAHTLRSTQRRPAFFNGQYSSDGWAMFFPYCFLVKTPLGLLGLLILGAMAAVTSLRRGSGFIDNESGESAVRRHSAPTAYALAPLLVLLAVYWVTAIMSHINIGERHLMPTYPALFILAGSASRWFQPRQGSVFRRAWSGAGLRLCVGASLLLLTVESLAIWPNYLAFFNQFAGGPSHGYRHLVDSSLDWGQEFKGLKQWLLDHPEDSNEPERVYFSYFGTALPAYYQVPGQQLPSMFDKRLVDVPKPLSGGVYCISATMLQCIYVNPPGRWNKDFEHDYEILRDEIEAYERSGRNPRILGQIFHVANREELESRLKYYEHFRFSRLCSFLRQREPDDQIGHSMLIYRLSDNDVERAVQGPPVELLDGPDHLPPK